MALLEVQGLTHHFGSVCTARDLHLGFEEGVVTSIIGPNGAGKSTLINLVTGHLPVQRGRIAFRGCDVTRLEVHRRVRLGICRSFQIANVFPRLTALENALIPVLALSGRARRPSHPAEGELCRPAPGSARLSGSPRDLPGGGVDARAAASQVWNQLGPDALRRPEPGADRPAGGLGSEVSRPRRRRRR